MSEMIEIKTRIRSNIKKMNEKEISDRMDMPVMRESALSYMTKITQQQLHDCGYYFIKYYEKEHDKGKSVSKIQLKAYHPDTITYGANENSYIPYPDEFLLTEMEAYKGERNYHLYQKKLFKSVATQILYQVYYGNIIPDGYTYDKSKQRIKKMEI